MVFSARGSSTRNDHEPKRQNYVYIRYTPLENLTSAQAESKLEPKTAKLRAARKKYSMVSTERWDEGPISDGNTYDISYDIASSQEALAALGA